MRLLLCFLLSGCVVKERVRVEYRTLPAKVIEKVYFIVPDSAVDKKKPSETEKNKEAQSWA